MISQRDEAGFEGLCPYYKVPWHAQLSGSQSLSFNSLYCSEGQPPLTDPTITMLVFPLFVSALWTGMYRCACAQWIPGTAVENRSLDEIYEAAQQESGELTILWGGDGKS